MESLSAYTLTGEVNTKRVTVKNEPPRYHQKESVPDAGLLKDKIRSSNGPVNAHKAKGNRFVYVISIERTKVTRIGNIEVNAAEIDTPFTKRFFHHLNETHDFDTYKQWVQETVRTHQALIASLESQLAQIAREQQAAHSEIVDIKAHILQTAKDEEDRKRQLADAEPLFVMNRNRITELEGFKRDTQERLQLALTDRKAATARTFADFQTELHKLIENWHKKPFCVRQEFVNLFLQDVILDSMSPHWLRLEIVWSHPAWETDILYIYRRRASADRWTDEERELLALHYSSASQEDLLRLFPIKTWHGITEEANHVGVTRAQWKWYDYPRGLSWADIQFMQEKVWHYLTEASSMKRRHNLYAGFDMNILPVGSISIRNWWMMRILGGRFCVCTRLESLSMTQLISAAVMCPRFTSGMPPLVRSNSGSRARSTPGCSRNGHTAFTSLCTLLRAICISMKKSMWFVLARLR